MHKTLTVPLMFYTRTLKTRYGNAQAIINNAMPKPNLGLFSSKDPEITSTIAKNPIMTGRICENIVVPIIAILNHYYNFTSFSYIKLT